MRSTVEAPVKYERPIFTFDHMTKHPLKAKHDLWTYYVAASERAFYNVTGLGVSERELGNFAVDVAQMIRYDAEALPESFGIEPKVFTRSSIDVLAESVIDSVPTRNEVKVKARMKEFIDILEKRFIYHYCNSDNIVQVCIAQGGIPKEIVIA